VKQAPSPIRWLVADAGAITGMDFSAARVLVEPRQDLAEKGVVLALARVSVSLKTDFDRQEVTSQIGPQLISPSRKQSLGAYHAHLAGKESEASNCATIA
jgi:sulfate permease, SulP family